MAISITKPTVGASQDTWGTTLNNALDTLVAAANGTAGYSAPNLEANNWKIQDVTVTASAAQLNLLSAAVGGTVTNDGVVVYGPAGEVAATTLKIGDWTFEQSGTDLKISYAGTAVFSLTSAGAITVTNDITAYGTI